MKDITPFHHYLTKAVPLCVMHFGGEAGPNTCFLVSPSGITRSCYSQNAGSTFPSLPLLNDVVTDTHYKIESGVIRRRR